MLSHFGHVQLFVTLWTVACQASLSLGVLSVLKWVTMPSSRGTSWPRDQTHTLPHLGKLTEVKFSGDIFDLSLPHPTPVQQQALPAMSSQFVMISVCFRLSSLSPCHPTPPHPHCIVSCLPVDIHNPLQFHHSGASVIYNINQSVTPHRMLLRPAVFCVLRITSRFFTVACILQPDQLLWPLHLLLSFPSFLCASQTCLSSPPSKPIWFMSQSLCTCRSLCVGLFTPALNVTGAFLFSELKCSLLTKASPDTSPSSSSCPHLPVSPPCFSFFIVLIPFF